MEGIDEGGPGGAGDAEEIVAETHVVMEVDDVGAELGEGAGEGLLEEAVGPVGRAAELHAIDAMEGAEAMIGAAFEASWGAGAGVGDVEDADGVAEGGEGVGEMEAVHLGALGGEGGELVDDLEDAHGLGVGQGRWVGRPVRFSQGKGVAGMGKPRKGQSFS